MSGAAAEAEDPQSGLDFGGWAPTGRKTAGPDSELIEVEDPDGNKQTAIVYDKAWRDHARLTTGVELVQSFMEFPMVEGISCLSRAPLGTGLFQYDTGSVLALIEVLRAYRDQRKPVGLKAAVELLQSIAHMLQEASENGPMQGIYSHGGITPWRITLDSDGDVQLLGYGLPQMDMEALREDDSLKVRDDSYKYCPPERITSGYEDISTDLYSLVLIAYEMITGDSLITGRSDALRKAVELGEAQGLMQASKDKAITKPIKDVFVHALAFDPIGRFEEPMEFLQSLQAAIGGKELSGASLAEVMEQVRKTTRRGKALMDAGTAGGPRRASLGERATRMKSAAAARPVRGRGPARSQDPSVSSDGRWGRVKRSGAEDDGDDAPVAGRPTRRRRGGADDDAASTSAVAARPTRRRRGGGDDDDDAASTSAVAARPTRRRRGGGDDDDDAASTSAARPTRRRRGGGDDDDDAASTSAARPTRRRRSSGDDDDSKASTLRRSSRTRSRAGGDDSDDDDDSTASTLRRSSRTRSRAGGDDDDSKDDTPTRSRRSRSKADDSDDDAKDDTPTRSRRSRSKADDGDDDAKDDTPTRSRRSRSKADDSDDDAKDDTPTRSRRSRSKADDSDDDAKDDTPTRSRRSRSKADDGDDDSKDDTPTRSRRSRSKADDGDDDAKDDTPTRSRRSRASADSGDDDDKPTRSRRSRASSDKE